MGVAARNGIYLARLVIWMIIKLRLQARGTLARSVEQLVEGRFAPLPSRCERVYLMEMDVAGDIGLAVVDATWVKNRC